MVTISLSKNIQIDKKEEMSHRTNEVGQHMSCIPNGASTCHAYQMVKTNESGNHVSKNLKSIKHRNMIQFQEDSQRSQLIQNLSR